MALQLYFSQWVNESEPGERFDLYPAIHTIIEAARASSSAIDLRRAEEQERAAGWCLVEVDVDRVLHDQIVAAGGIWVDPKNVTRADIVTHIGDEGLALSPKLDTVEDIKREIKRVHDTRNDRWKGR